MHEREKLTHGSCLPCGVGGAEPSSHSPGQDDGSRKAWRQGLLSWLLCHRVQSSQVRAELCNSQCGACSKLGGGSFSPLSKSGMGPDKANGQMDKAYGTSKCSMALLEQDREGWCLLIFPYEEEPGGWLG